MNEIPQRTAEQPISGDYFLIDKETYEHMCACRDEHEKNLFDASRVAGEMLEKYLNEMPVVPEKLTIEVEDRGGFDIRFSPKFKVQTSDSPKIGVIRLCDVDGNSPVSALYTGITNIFNKMWQERCMKPKELFKDYFMRKFQVLEWLKIIVTVSLLLNIVLGVMLFRS